MKNFIVFFTLTPHRCGHTAATYLKVCGTCVEKRHRRLYIWKFIETHVIYVSVDESQLGQSPNVMKVGLYGKPFEHLFNILDIRLKVHVLVSFLSSLVRQFGALVELLGRTSRTTVSYQ